MGGDRCRSSSDARRGRNDLGRRRHDLVGRLERTTDGADRHKKIVCDFEAVDRLLIDVFIEAHETPPKEIILDLDATDEWNGTTADYRWVLANTVEALGGRLIAGFGRFGQIIGRILRAKRIGFTALDISSEHVDFVRRYGNEIYYGYASRLDLLHAAGAAHASVFVLAIALGVGGPSDSSANPAGGVVAAGSATISTPAPNELTA